MTKQSPTPLLYVGLYSSDGRYDTLYLRNYLTLNVKDELSRLNGIGHVGLYGAGDYAMRIWLDPNKLSSRNLTATDVLNAIREQNVQVSAGQLGAEPSPNTTDFLVSINVRGRLATEEEFGAIVLKSGEDGQVVRLADVARILQLGAGDYTMRVFEEQDGSDRRRLSIAGRQRARRGGCGLRQVERAVGKLSPGHYLQGGLGSDRLRARVHSRSAEHAARGGVARHPRCRSFCKLGGRRLSR